MGKIVVKNLYFVSDFVLNIDRNYVGKECQKEKYIIY